MTQSLMAKVHVLRRGEAASLRTFSTVSGLVRQVPSARRPRTGSWGHRLRRILCLHRTTGRAHHFARQSAWLTEDIILNAPDGPPLPRRPALPVLWCRAASSPVPAAVDAVLLADDQCPPTALVDALARVLRQRADRVQRVTFMVPCPSTPTMAT